MSADNSPQSASNPAPSTAENSRYRRAADAAMERTPADLSKQQARDQQRLRQVRAELAHQDRETRGRSRILNDVAQILGGDQPSPPSAPSGAGDGRSLEADRRQPSNDAASPGVDPSAPGLQLDDGERAAAKAKAKTLKAYAAEKELSEKELLGLALDDLGDEPVTIADLKTRWKESADLDNRKDGFEDWRVEQQNEILQARTELELTVQELAANLPPAAIAQATERAKLALQAQVTKARGQLAEWFPEWNDAQVKAADRDAFSRLMATYGFSKAEVEGVLDARLIKFGIDAMRLMDRYKRLREGERERQPSTQAPAKAKPKSAVNNVNERSQQLVRSGDKMGAVAALLGG